MFYNKQGKATQVRLSVQKQMMVDGVEGSDGQVSRLHHSLLTIHTADSIIHYQLFPRQIPSLITHRSHCTVRHPLLTVHAVQSVIHYSLFTLHNPLSITHRSHCTVRHPLLTVHSAQSVIHYSPFTPHSPLSIAHRSHCTVRHPLLLSLIHISEPTRHH